jgi:hypothetical protein
MFPVRRITIKGRRYTLRQAAMKDSCGQCDHPTAPGPEIRISKKLRRGELLLDTLIHEALHASNWDLSEEFVDQFGSDMARILWRLGYRAPWDT